MAGGAGSITATQPVLVVEDRASGARAFHFLMEGFGRSLCSGCTTTASPRDSHGSATSSRPRVRPRVAPRSRVDVGAVIAESLRRGDELHNRNAAATSMLVGLLAPALAADPPRRAERAFFAFLAGNPQFFVGAVLAAAASRSTPATASRDRAS